MPFVVDGKRRRAETRDLLSLELYPMDPSEVPKMAKAFAKAFEKPEPVRFKRADAADGKA